MVLYLLQFSPEKSLRSVKREEETFRLWTGFLPVTLTEDVEGVSSSVAPRQWTLTQC